MTRLRLLLTCIFFTTPTAFAGDAPALLHQWHQWRGPTADGVAPKANPPVQWDERTNIKWKAAIPGLGSSTPIIWEEQVFVLTAVQTDRVGRPAADHGAQPQRRGNRGTVPTNFYRFLVMSFDRATGALNWQRTAAELLPHEGFLLGQNTFASGSPTTDGRLLYASFGSYGIYCYDLKGELQWKQDLGDMQTRRGFGEGCSPTLYGDALVVNWDHEGDSFITTLDARTGKPRWKVNREEVTSWATPLVVDHAGRAQVVVNATARARGYDLATGKLLWECGGQTVNTIPSPVTSDGIVYCMSGYRSNALYAIPLDSEGDLTGGEKLAWYHNQGTAYRPGTPYVPSPLLYGGLLYFTKTNNAILSCLDARTGTVVYDNKRLPGLGTVYASPLGAAGRIYIVDRSGTTIVLGQGPEFDVLAVNRLDEPIDASPAAAGNELFLRSNQHLYCIAAQ